MPTFVGVTAIEVNVAGLTVSGADPVTGVTPPKEAEIDVEPDATPVARPTLPDELLMVATGIWLLAHTTSCVMFWVLLSLKLPIAVKACVVVGGIVVLDGATAIETIVAEVTSSVAVPVNDS
jgi:hypothetical protein